MMKGVVADSYNTKKGFGPYYKSKRAHVSGTNESPRVIFDCRWNISKNRFPLIEIPWQKPLSSRVRDTSFLICGTVYHNQNLLTWFFVWRLVVVHGRSGGAVRRLLAGQRWLLCGRRIHWRRSGRISVCAAREW